MLKSLHDISVSDQMWELGFNICPRLVSLHENPWNVQEEL